MGSSTDTEGAMPPDLWSLYALMLRCRLFEEAVARLWRDGLISGEMHLGTGEEAIVAGIVPQLLEGDALALDHRGTAALLLRGVEPVSILAELLGRPDGLCGGQGGHMHLFSREHLAASSGIIGAARTCRGRFRTGGPHAAPRCARRGLLWRGRHEPGDAAGGTEPGRGLDAARPVRLQGRRLVHHHLLRHSDRRRS